MKNNQISRESEKTIGLVLRKSISAFQAMPRVFALVWRAQPLLASVFCFSQVMQGLIPIAQVWCFKLLVDAIPGAHLREPCITLGAVSLPQSVVLALGLMTVAWFFSEIATPSRRILS